MGLAALICAAPAAAAVTVGQVAPGTITSCSNTFDFLQRSTPDNSYAMPATGVITSWTHRSQVGMGQTPTLKIFRKIGDPEQYLLVGHDGPNPIDPNTTKTFTSNLAVRAGDVIGITGAGGAANIGCSYSAPGLVGFHTPNLADGGSGDFGAGGLTGRLNVSVVLNPTNTFTLGAVARNKKKGTATVAVTVPNAGELVLSGNGVKAAAGARASATATAPGEVQLPIRAQGKKKKKLAATGKVKLSPTITYTPTGGDPTSQSLQVKLKKNKK